MFHFEQFDIVRHLTDQEWHLTTDEVIGCHGIYSYVGLGWQNHYVLTCHTHNFPKNRTGWFVVNYGRISNSDRYDPSDYDVVQQCVVCYGVSRGNEIHIETNPDGKAPFVLINHPDVMYGGFKAARIRIKYYETAPWYPKSVEMLNAIYNGDYRFTGGVITWGITEDDIPLPKHQYGFSIGDFEKYNVFSPNVPDEVEQLYILNSDDPSRTFREMIFAPKSRDV